VSHDVDHRQYKCEKHNVAEQVVEQVVERSLSEEDFLGRDDELLARRVIVWVKAHVVYHQPAQDVRRIQHYRTHTHTGNK